VTIGLIDGEWVEIEDGLNGDELVVVDIASGDVASAA
jgi:multidrug efflux pump subunit AcrA (membrane-fusion protein)